MEWHEKRRVERFSELKRKVISEGYELISTEYQHSTDVLHFKCVNGHDYYNRLDLFMNGKRCKKCYDIRMENLTGLTKAKKKKDIQDKIEAKNKKEVEDFSTLISQDEYTIVTSRFNNPKNKKVYIIQCSNGRTISTTKGEYIRGKRCKRCNHSGRANPNEKAVSDWLEDNGCKLIEFINTKKNLKFICSCGKMDERNYYSMTKGYVMCNSCVRKQSKRKTQLKKISEYEELNKQKNSPTS